MLRRLLFPLEGQEFGVQDQQFRQGLLALSAVVHALANRIGPLLGNMLDPFFALNHEGERPQGMTLADRHSDRRACRNGGE